MSITSTQLEEKGGVNSFLVTVWLSMMVRSLRRSKKKNAASSRLTHNDHIPWKQVNPLWTLLLSRRGKPEWVSTFATHCMNVNIVKVWTDEWSLAYSFIFLIDMTGLTPTPCTFSDIYREKRGECSRSLGGWPVKLNR